MKNKVLVYSILFLVLGFVIGSIINIKKPLLDQPATAVSSGNPDSLFNSKNSIEYTKILSEIKDQYNAGVKDISVKDIVVSLGGNGFQDLPNVSNCWEYYNGSWSQVTVWGGSIPGSAFHLPGFGYIWVTNSIIPSTYVCSSALTYW